MYENRGVYTSLSLFSTVSISTDRVLTLSDSYLDSRSLGLHYGQCIHTSSVNLYRTNAIYYFHHVTRCEGFGANRIFNSEHLSCTCHDALMTFTTQVSYVWYSELIMSDMPSPPIHSRRGCVNDDTVIS